MSGRPFLAEEISTAADRSLNSRPAPDAKMSSMVCLRGRQSRVDNAGYFFMGVFLFPVKSLFSAIDRYE